VGLLGARHTCSLVWRFIQPSRQHIYILYIFIFQWSATTPSRLNGCPILLGVIPRTLARGHEGVSPSVTVISLETTPTLCPSGRRGGGIQGSTRVHNLHPGSTRGVSPFLKQSPRPSPRLVGLVRRWGAGQKTVQLDSKWASTETFPKPVPSARGRVVREQHLHFFPEIDPDPFSPPCPQARNWAREVHKWTLGLALRPSLKPVPCARGKLGSEGSNLGLIPHGLDILETPLAWSD